MIVPDLPLLLPVPRHVALSGGTFALPDRRLIVVNTSDPQALRFAALRLQRTLRDRAAVHWEIVAGAAVPQDQIGIVLSIVPGGARHPQGYELTITPEGIHAGAATPAGAFYATCTLIQLIESCPQAPIADFHLPTLHISDWPDFPTRGVMLDISRDRVPTMETLFALVDLLASWKINQFQLYTEHTFAYRNHPEVWVEASPMTGEEILALDACCRERFVELVPNQNSFGHLHRWLRHERYRHLAEAPHGCMTRWGYLDEPFSLCPLDPGSLELVRSLYDELLPHFSSRMFNVGCDETVDLGQGRSQEAVGQSSVGRVYLDFLLKIYREVQTRGRTMQFWGDIVLQHSELIPALPRDALALAWGYEADHPFDAEGARFAAAGIPFYVCPGTSSWRSIAGRTDNALGNLLNAAENGLKHGAIGYLIIDWGDLGHWQPLPVSYLGFAVGAAFSWALDANRALDVPRAVGRHAFRDPSGTMGRVAYDLGNVYRAVGVEPPNSSVLFQLLQQPSEQIRDVTPAALKRALGAIEQAVGPLPGAQIGRADAELIRREYAHAAQLLQYACHRGLAAMETEPVQAGRPGREQGNVSALILEYKALWSARCRPGGLTDSVARMERSWL
jgi:hypothetical protein